MTSKRLTPIKAIKQYCKVDCCCNDLKSWKDCTRKVCPLYPYRIGKRPIKLPFEAYSSKKPIATAIKVEENKALGEVLK